MHSSTDIFMRIFLNVQDICFYKHTWIVASVAFNRLRGLHSAFTNLFAKDIFQGFSLQKAENNAEVSNAFWLTFIPYLGQ